MKIAAILLLLVVTAACVLGFVAALVLALEALVAWFAPKLHVVGACRPTTPSHEDDHG